MVFHNKTVWQQNNRMLLDIFKSMMSQENLYINFWRDVTLIVAYILNITIQIIVVYSI